MSSITHLLHSRDIYDELTIFINLNFLTMKNYLKFVVAVFGVTVATFGSINTNAKVNANVTCSGPGMCGYTPDCQEIYGYAH